MTRSRITLYLSIFLGIILSIGILLTIMTFNETTQASCKEGELKLDILYEIINTESEYNKLVLKEIISSAIVKEVLLSDDIQGFKQAELFIERYRKGYGFLDIYVLDKEKKPVISSLGEGMTSLPRDDYFNISKYKKRCCAGRGLCFAFKRGTHTPVMINSVTFTGHSGTRKWSIVGVKKISNFQKTFSKYGNSFLVSPDGVIIIAGNKELIPGTLFPISDYTRDIIISTGKFGTGPFPAFLSEKYKGLENNDLFFLGAQPYLYMKKFILPDMKGWYMATFQPASAIVVNTAFAAFLSLIVIAGFLLLSLKFIKTRSMLEKKEEKEEITVKENIFLVEIIESVGHPFYVIDASDYKVVLANSAAREKGIKEGTECCHSIKFRQCAGEEFSAECCPARKVVEFGESVRVEGTWGEGEQRSVYDIHCYPRKDSGGKVIQVIEYMEDITERKKTLHKLDQALREAVKSREVMVSMLDDNNEVRKQLEREKKNFSDIVNGNMDAIIIINKDLKVLYANSLSLEMFNTVSETFIGSKFTFPLDIGEVQEITLSKGKGTAGVGELRSINIEWEGKAAVLVMIKDITARKKAEEHVEIFQRFAEESGQGFTLSSDDGKITYINPTFSSMIGVKNIRDIIGRHFSDFVSEGDRGNIKNILSKELAAKNQWSGEIKIASEEGLDIAVLQDFFYIKDRSGNPLYIAGITVDISDRKRIEEAQRLVDLGRLVSDMAHEVNNPLMVISGRAQLSLMDPTEEELEENNKIIIDQCQRAKNIIQRLLQFSRPSKGEMKSICVSEVIGFVVKIIEHQFLLKNVNIRRHCEDEGLMVKADEKQLHEVFMNLMKNALDAMPQGGDINIDVASEGVSGVKIAVSDTGEGMSRQILDKIFDPFFTTKETGTGLGLSVCYGIVQAHGGEMKYFSEEGKGTKVVILLPRAKEEDVSDAA